MKDSTKGFVAFAMFALSVTMCLLSVNSILGFMCGILALVLIGNGRMQDWADIGQFITPRVFTIVVLLSGTLLVIGQSLNT